MERSSTPSARSSWPSVAAEHIALQWLPIVLLERGDVRLASELMESIELQRPDSQWVRSAPMLLARIADGVRIAAGVLDSGSADLLDADRRTAAAGLRLSVQTDWVAECQHWRCETRAVSGGGELVAGSSQKRSPSAAHDVMGSRCR